MPDSPVHYNNKLKCDFLATLASAFWLLSFA